MMEATGKVKKWSIKPKKLIWRFHRQETLLLLLSNVHNIYSGAACPDKMIYWMVFKLGNQCTRYQFERKENGLIRKRGVYFNTIQVAENCCYKENFPAAGQCLLCLPLPFAPATKFKRRRSRRFAVLKLNFKSKPSWSQSDNWFFLISNFVHWNWKKCIIYLIIYFFHLSFWRQ
jgi:hypothetical protein